MQHIAAKECDDGSTSSDGHVDIELGFSEEEIEALKRKAVAEAVQEARREWERNLETRICEKCGISITPTDNLGDLTTFVDSDVGAKLDGICQSSASENKNKVDYVQEKESLEGKIDQLIAQLGEAGRSVELLREENQSLKSEVEKFKGSFDDISTERISFRQKLFSLNEELSELKQKICSTENSVKDKEKQLEAKERSLKEKIAASLQNATSQALQYKKECEDLSQVIASLRKQREALTRDIESSKIELGHQKKALAEILSQECEHLLKSSVQPDSVSKFEAQREALSAELASARKEIDMIKIELSDTKNAYQMAEREKSNLEKQIDSLKVRSTSLQQAENKMESLSREMAALKEENKKSSEDLAVSENEKKQLMLAVKSVQETNSLAEKDVEEFSNFVKSLKPEFGLERENEEEFDSGYSKFFALKVKLKSMFSEAKEKMVLWKDAAKEKEKTILELQAELKRFEERRELERQKRRVVEKSLDWYKKELSKKWEAGKLPAPREEYTVQKKRKSSMEPSGSEKKPLMLPQAGDKQSFDLEEGELPLSVSPSAGKTPLRKSHSPSARAAVIQKPLLPFQDGQKNEARKTVTENADPEQAADQITNWNPSHKQTAVATPAVRKQVAPVDSRNEDEEALKENLAKMLPHLFPSRGSNGSQGLDSDSSPAQQRHRQEADAPTEPTAFAEEDLKPEKREEDRYFSGRKMGGGKSERRCFACGNAGHIAVGCPRRVGESSLLLLVCHGCRQKGHVAADCPYRKK